MKNTKFKTSLKITAVFLLLAFLWPNTGCSLFTEPENKAKLGFTAREAEQLASSRALERMANPVLVSIETPESGGGVDRNGRLALREKGKWLFGYFTPGSNQGLLVEVAGARAYDYVVTIDNLPGLQEILPNYIDSSDALKTAELNGGKKLENVAIILCQLTGEPRWPRTNPKKVVWKITYKLESGEKHIYYIEAYDNIFLGRE